MWGKRRQETQPEYSPDADVQKFFAAMAPEPAKEEAPQAAAEAHPAPARQENSTATQVPSPALDEKTQAFWRGKLATANFGGAVSLFMRSPAHRHYTLADLEWCLIPALALNQFMVAEAKLPNGQAVPVALVLWARVSDEIDARLSSAPRYPLRLHPNEWQSGDVFWIIGAAGEPKAVQQCIDMLAKTAFEGTQFKMLSRRAKVPMGPQERREYRSRVAP
jgi:hemolysin-activating ACP:hemolysin acyltransferase